MNRRGFLRGILPAAAAVTVASKVAQAEPSEALGLRPKVTFLPSDSIEQVRYDVRLAAVTERWRMVSTPFGKYGDWEVMREWDEEPGEATAIVSANPMCPKCGTMPRPMTALLDCEQRKILCECGHTYWARFYQRQQR